MAAFFCITTYLYDIKPTTLNHRVPQGCTFLSLIHFNSRKNNDETEMISWHVNNYLDGRVSLTER